MAVTVDGPKITFNLIAQSPMIHFQAGEYGATLRGSEVKPKLDRYLIRRMLKSETGSDDPENFQQLKKSHPNFFIDAAHDALDYKISFVERDSNRAKSNGEHLDQYSLYCWNMGLPDDKKKVGLWTNPECTIICFNEELRKAIAENIEKFFLVTNFGTMQDKGFGSFIPESFGFNADKTLDDTEMSSIARALNEETGRSECYVAKFDGVSTSSEKSNSKGKNKGTLYAVKMTEEIKYFYSIMKSGYNYKGYSRTYLYQYMHKYFNMNNEKAWMKQKRIMHPVCKKENKEKWDRQDKDAKYIRAFFGVGEGTGPIINKKPEVSINGGDRERVQSIMFFKIIRNCVFITCYDIPDEMYGAKFSFSGNGKSMPIYTPTKEEMGKFNIDEFLASYVNYFNELIKGKAPNSSVDPITDKNILSLKPVTEVGGGQK